MFKRKICSVEGCPAYVWKNQMCARHMPKKSTKPFKTYTPKVRTYDSNAMRDMFLEVWESMETPRRCYETNVILSSEPNTMMFHHILEKRNYPQYALCKWNIVVVHPDMHATLELDLNRAPKVKALTEKLLKQHEDGTLPTTD